MESEDLIFDLINNALKTKDRRQKILFKDREYDILDLELERIKEYLRTIPNTERIVIYNAVKEFNANQLSVFLETIQNFRKSEKPAKQLIVEIKNIKKGLFPKYLNYKTTYTSGCLETYTGFIRALNSGTLYTAKVKVDGKLKRVFIKTPIGHVNVNHSNNQGFLSFAIDPETMNVYSYRFNEAGKIQDGSLEEVYNFKKYKKKLFNLYTEESRSYLIENYSAFRKELLNKIDAVYGIERVVDTFLRMGGKINSVKYSNLEFKEEMIHYLKDKFGTDKLLNWASRIKDPKKSYETKLEILKILAKKYGLNSARFYNLEQQKVEKVIKTQRTKLKTRNLRGI